MARSQVAAQLSSALSEVRARAASRSPTYPCRFFSTKCCTLSDGLLRAFDRSRMGGPSGRHKPSRDLIVRPAAFELGLTRRQRKLRAHAPVMLAPGDLQRADISGETKKPAV